jgi:AraC-like DNA-binding protein
MSRDGQCPKDLLDSSSGVVVVTFPMPAGQVFDWHTHDDHQLAWAPSGVLTVRTEHEAWVLPPTRALWIPAGVQHETMSTNTTTMRTLYVEPSACPVQWRTCTPIGVSPLLAQLIDYLEDRALDTGRRENAETLLVDLLTPVAMTVIDVRMPVEERARRIAESLLEHPEDNRTLAEWGDLVGASARTLARVFIAESGLQFGRWRTMLRLRLALASLAAGEPVANVARCVGYESSSAFVAAFRKETGVTPSAYFRSQPSIVGSG